MKLAHNVLVNVFSKPEDDEAKVRKALISLFPFDLEKEKVMISEHGATGFNDRKIRILEARISKNSLINGFMGNLKEKLGDDCRRLVKEAESRTDEELHFFIRLNKAKLLAKGIYSVTDSGDCFHIRISPAAFPKKRENAIKLMKAFFSR